MDLTTVERSSGDILASELHMSMKQPDSYYEDRFNREYVYDGEVLQAVVDRHGGRLHQVHLACGKRISSFEMNPTLKPPSEPKKEKKRRCIIS